MSTWIGACVSCHIAAGLRSNLSILRFTAILTSRFILDLYETEASLSPSRTTYGPSTSSYPLAFEYSRPSVSRPLEDAKSPGNMAEVYGVVVTVIEEEDPFELWKCAVALLDSA